MLLVLVDVDQYGAGRLPRARAPMSSRLSKCCDAWERACGRRVRARGGARRRVRWVLRVLLREEVLLGGDAGECGRGRGGGSAGGWSGLRGDRYLWQRHRWGNRMRRRFRGALGRRLGRRRGARQIRHRIGGRYGVRAERMRAGPGGHVRGRRAERVGWLWVLRASIVLATIRSGTRCHEAWSVLTRWCLSRSRCKRRQMTWFCTWDLITQTLDSIKYSWEKLPKFLYRKHNLMDYIQYSIHLWLCTLSECSVIEVRKPIGRGDWRFSSASESFSKDLMSEVLEPCKMASPTESAFLSGCFPGRRIFAGEWPVYTEVCHCPMGQCLK